MLPGTAKTYKTEADAQGKWAMKIETPQAAGPYELSLSDGKELKLHNILIGEVWICSGQSNMGDADEGIRRHSLLRALLKN